MKITNVQLLASFSFLTVLVCSPAFGRQVQIVNQYKSAVSVELKGYKTTADYNAALKDVATADENAQLLSFPKTSASGSGQIYESASGTFNMMYIPTNGSETVDIGDAVVYTYVITPGDGSGQKVRKSASTKNVKVTFDASANIKTE